MTMNTNGLDKICGFMDLSPTLATAGQPSEDELGFVARAGYEIVINLGLTQTEYALADEASTVRRLGMEYVHIPVSWEAPGQTDLDRFFAVMNTNRASKCFVHCAANKRVSIFVCLFRIACLGWPRSEALADVYHIWTPDVVWQRFIEQALRRY